MFLRPLPITISVKKEGGARDRARVQSPFGAKVRRGGRRRRRRNLRFPVFFNSHGVRAIGGRTHNIHCTDRHRGIFKMPRLRAGWVPFFFPLWDLALDGQAGLSRLPSHGCGGGDGQGGKGGGGGGGSFNILEQSVTR